MSFVSWSTCPSLPIICAIGPSCRHHRGGLEAHQALVQKADRALRLLVFRHDVASVHHAARHVLAVARVALNGLVLLLRHRVCDHWRESAERKVDARVRHQVRLKLGQICIDRAVEAQCQQAVEVLVCRALDAQAAAVNVAQHLVVHHEGDVKMLHFACAHSTVVELHHRRRDLRIQNVLRLEAAQTRARKLFRDLL